MGRNLFRATTVVVVALGGCAANDAARTAAEPAAPVLVFGTSFGCMESMVSAAGEYKNVKFEQAEGFERTDNLRTYNSRLYEGAYLAGVVAGSKTRSNTLGVVDPVPVPEVLLNINAFTLGAPSAAVEKTKAGLKDGSFHPWTGPVVDQAGKVVVAKGRTPDDAFLLGVNFYVKGVEGKVPAGAIRK